MGAINLKVGLGGMVARIGINRPDRMNAFDRETLRELGDLIRGVGESQKVRLVVIEGEGGKAFCTGGDLQAAAASDSISNYLGSLARAFHSVLEHLSQCPAVVLTNITGVAAGGGLALALAGDLRWATPEARFRVGYGRVGLSVDGGLSWRLPRVVGLAQAQRLFIEDPDLDAAQAQALGLVHRIVPTPEIGKAVQELLERLKVQSRSALVRTRELLLGSLGRPFVQSMEAEAVLLKTSAGTADGQEGVRAFVQKRPPQFGS